MAPGRWGNPGKWGNPSVRIKSPFIVDHVYIRGGVPYQGGLPGHESVTRLGRVRFCTVFSHVNYQGAVTCLAWVRQLSFPKPVLQ